MGVPHPHRLTAANSISRRSGRVDDSAVPCGLFAAMPVRGETLDCLVSYPSIFSLPHFFALAATPARCPDLVPDRSIDSQRRVPPQVGSATASDLDLRQVKACSWPQMGEQLLNDRVAMSRIYVLDVDDTMRCGGNLGHQSTPCSKMWSRLRGAAAQSGTPRLHLR